MVFEPFVYVQYYLIYYNRYENRINYLRQYDMQEIIPEPYPALNKEPEHIYYETVNKLAARDEHNGKLDIFRIEYIVAHTLVKGDEEILFSGNYQNRINSPLITTGNELVKEQISDFTKQLDIDELYSYVADVKKSTEAIIHDLTYGNLKIKVPDERKENLQSLGVVSDDENAVWLIDYWCQKDVRGLIQMPFSRHWIMHIEACLRIRNKLKK